MSVRCFWLETLRRTRLTLRRYAGRTNAGPCPKMGGEHSYHNTHAPLFDVDETLEYDDRYKTTIYQHSGPQTRDEVPAEYPWPEFCECGYVFKEEDNWQVFSETLYRRSDTGQILTIDEAGPGAMWEMETYSERSEYKGPDGICLAVKCPDGKTWIIDSQCNNCTMPEDHVHKCWVRHGNPPDITVNKNGHTCSAGGGSIDTGTYHGFLVNGVFNNC